MRTRSIVLVAAGAALALGCGARRGTARASATTASADACVALAERAVAVVKAPAPAGGPPVNPLTIELWSSLYADACRNDRWSDRTHACYRAASSIAAFNACEDAQPEAERIGLRRLVREAQPYLPDKPSATATREEIQAGLVVPIWGYPPAHGDTFAACDAYQAQLEGLRSCKAYADPHLNLRISMLEMQRAALGEMSPRVRGMWLGYCEAEAARRRCPDR